MLVGTQADGPLQGRAVAAWADVDSLMSAAPSLSSVTGALLPDEPIENYVSSQPSSAWLLDEGGTQSVEFLFTRFFIVSPLSVGIARSPVSQLAPAQVEVPVDMLFKPVPAADGGMVGYRPALMSGGLRLGELRYFYVCNPPPGMDPSVAADGACRIARVLATQVHDGTRYEYWSDGQWVSELERATPVLSPVSAALTVSPNSYLHKLLLVHSGSNNDVRLAWADEPQGPFHEFSDAIATAPGTGGSIKLSYGAAELPVPHGDCDRELVVWYSVPVEQEVANADPRVKRETHVMRLRFK